MLLWLNRATTLESYLTPKDLGWESFGSSPTNWLPSYNENKSQTQFCHPYRHLINKHINKQIQKRFLQRDLETWRCALCSLGILHESLLDIGETIIHRQDSVLYSLPWILPQIQWTNTRASGGPDSSPLPAGPSFRVHQIHTKVEVFLKYLTNLWVPLMPPIMAHF